MAWIADRTKFWFTQAFNSDDQDCWTIVAGRECSPSGQWRQYARREANGESCDFLVDNEQRCIVIDLPPGRWRQLFALRMIRNVLRWELFRDGAIFLHASCLSMAGEGFALIGPRRSGKSSLVLSALRSGDWEYVTEDDLTLVRQADGSWTGLGWPGCLRIRRAMLKSYPEIQKSLDVLQHPANDLERNLDPDTARVRVFPEELARIYGCKLAPRATMRRLAFLRWATVEHSCIAPPQRLLTQIVESWDVLPERKAGITQCAAATDWGRQVFDPFLLTHYGVPPLALYEADLKDIAHALPGLEIEHIGVISRGLTHCLLGHGQQLKAQSRPPGQQPAEART